MLPYLFYSYLQEVVQYLYYKGLERLLAFALVLTTKGWLYSLKG
jgi:hypothetical protein